MWNSFSRQTNVRRRRRGREIGKRNCRIEILLGSKWERASSESLSRARFASGPRPRSDLERGRDREREGRGRKAAWRCEERRRSCGGDELRRARPAASHRGQRVCRPRSRVPNRPSLRPPPSLPPARARPKVAFSTTFFERPPPPGARRQIDPIWRSPVAAADTICAGEVQTRVGQGE